MRTILIADDHPLVRTGIRAQLELLGQAQVLESWDEASTRSTLARVPHVDLVLLDIQMPGESGPAWTHDLCRQMPNVPVLLVSGLNVQEIVQRYRHFPNVRGVLQKGRPNQEFREAIDLALAGRTCWPTIEQWGDKGAASHVNEVRQGSLTPRQSDVARLVCAGLSNRDIAERLAMQEGTVKNHLKEVFVKMGVSNRTQLARRLDLEQWAGTGNGGHPA